MPARKPGPAVALDIEGALRAPDLSQFEGTMKDRVKCLTCGKCGKANELWVYEHLTGHPETCPEPGCGRVFTRPDMLNRHMRAHGKLFNEIPGETDQERWMRLRRERRERLQEAGLNEEASAA